MTDATEWQGRVGEAWAEEWKRTDRSFSVLTDHLLATSRGATVTNVLDIGCGAGELSLALSRGYPDARITGIDLSSDLIAAARSRAAPDTNVEFLIADAANWRPGGSAKMDFLISRHGVMFFDDPEMAFRNLAGLAAPGAKLAFSCFRAAGENEWVRMLQEFLPQPSSQPDPNAPGPFAFANRTRVLNILEQAGWSNIAFDSVDYPMVFGAGADPVEEAIQFFRKIGPLAAALKEMPEEDRGAILERLRETSRARLEDGVIAFPAAAWIVTATK